MANQAHRLGDVMARATGPRASGGGRPRTDVASRRSVPERLVQVASRLFADRGFEGTSVQEIVEAASVTKGAMYHYFGSKDDLLYEIYGRVLRMQMEQLHLRPLVISSQVNVKRMAPQWQLAM